MKELQIFNNANFDDIRITERDGYSASLCFPAVRLSLVRPPGLFSSPGGRSEGFLFGKDTLPVGPVIRPAAGPMFFPMGSMIGSIVCV